MVISILYYEGCPHWRDAEAKVRAALSESACDAVVVLKAVDADNYDPDFNGSPTILMDGQDAFPNGSQSTGLSCRYYLTGDGLRGTPSSEQIAALFERMTSHKAKEG